MAELEDNESVGIQKVFKIKIERDLKSKLKGHLEYLISIEEAFNKSALNSVASDYYPHRNYMLAKSNAIREVIKKYTSTFPELEYRVDE